jgi:hypothetical protein
MHALLERHLEQLAVAALRLVHEIGSGGGGEHLAVDEVFRELLLDQVRRRVREPPLFQHEDAPQTSPGRREDSRAAAGGARHQDGSDGLGANGGLHGDAPSRTRSAQRRHRTA